MSNVTFSSKVVQKSSVAKGKTITYSRHPNGQLSLNGVMLTPEKQAAVEKQLRDNVQR